MQRVMQAYFNTTATTTSPGDVIIMLYDGAISFLERAKQKIIEKDYAQKGILISKAMDVIGELDGSLNIDKGGNLAENLHSLYFFCNTHLLQANLKMDTEKIDKVITILTDLRDAFATIINTPEAVQAAQNNAMSQRAQAPQVRMPVSRAPAPASMGTARASSFYSKNTQAFASPQRPVAPSPKPVPATDQPAFAPTQAPIPSGPQVMAQDQTSGAPHPAQAAPKASPVMTGHISAPKPLPETTQAEPSHAPDSSSLESAKVLASPTTEGDPPAKAPESQQNTAPTPPPSRLGSRFQGAAMYKKFAQN